MKFAFPFFKLGGGEFVPLIDYHQWVAPVPEVFEAGGAGDNGHGADEPSFRQFGRLDTLSGRGEEK